MSQKNKDFPSSEKIRLSRPKIRDWVDSLKSNFAGTSAPVADSPESGDLGPVEGQTWFSTSTRRNQQRRGDQWVDTATLDPFQTTTALRAVQASEGVGNGTVALVLGLSAVGDCPPFYVKWVASSSAAHDGFGVFRPTAGAASSGNGRWVRINVNPSATFTSADATPSIANGVFFITDGSTTITDFDDAYEGQIFVVQRGGADITIAHDPTKIDTGGQPLRLTTNNQRAAFIHINGIHRLIGASRNLDSLPRFVPATLDATGIDAAVALAAAAGGGVIVVPGTAATDVGANILVEDDNIWFEFEPGAVMNCSGTAIQTLTFSGALVGSATTVSSNALTGADEITVTTIANLADSGDALAKEDCLLIETTLASPGAYGHKFAVQVAAVSGSVVTLAAPLPFDLLTTDTHTIKRFRPVKNCGVRRGRFNGSGGTGVCHGLNVYYAVGFEADLEASGFTSGVGVATQATIRDRISCRAVNCGSGSFGDQHFIASTGGIYDCVSDLASGVGPLWDHCHHFYATRAHSFFGASRAVKLKACTNFHIADTRVFGAVLTGVFFDDHCSNGVFDTVNVQNCGNPGFNLNGEHQRNIRVKHLYAKGNATWDLAVGTADTGFVCDNINPDAVVGVAPDSIVTSRDASTGFINTICAGRTVEWQDASGVIGPVDRLWRNSASPAAGDFLGARDYVGENASSAAISYVRDYAKIGDATAGSEDGERYIDIYIGGVATTVFKLAPGLALGSNTPQGVGTANCTDYYRAGVKIGAGFRARLSANQTGIAPATSTKVTFDTEDYDPDGIFNTTTNRCTPGAGPVTLSASVYCSAGLTTGGYVQIEIRKNGSQMNGGIKIQEVTATFNQVHLSVDDVANGTDYYEVFVNGSSAGTITVNNSATLTFFSCRQN